VGFYALKTDSCYIILRGEHRGKDIKIKANLERIWHTGASSEIMLGAKLDRKDIWDIDSMLRGEESILVSWEVLGYGLPEEGKLSELGLKYPLVRIRLVPDRYYRIPRTDFVRRVLEPIDKFKREFIEVVIPTPEMLDRAPEDLKPLVELIQKQSFLVDALKKTSDARIPSEYRDAIKSVRDAIDRAHDSLSTIKDAMTDKLYLEVGTFKGKGARDTARIPLPETSVISKKVFLAISS